MSWLKKIKEFFFSKDAPLPASDEFSRNRDDFDPEHIFDSNDSNEKSSIDSDSPPKRRGTDAPYASDNIGDLFVDEDDDIDAEDLRTKGRSELSNQEEKDDSSDRSDKSPEDMQESLKKEAKRAGKKLRESADKVNEKVDEFLDKTVEKSKKLDEIEAEEKKASSGFMKYREKSMLDDQGDFFSKAKAFAEGRPLSREEDDDSKDDADDPKSQNKHKSDRRNRLSDDDIEDAIVVDDDDKE